MECNGSRKSDEAVAGEAAVNLYQARLVCVCVSPGTGRSKCIGVCSVAAAAPCITTFAPS